MSGRVRAVKERDRDLPARVAEAAALTLELDDLVDTVHALVTPDLADLVGIHLPTPQGMAPYLSPRRRAEPPHPHRHGLARRLDTRQALPFDTDLPAVRAFVTGRTIVAGSLAEMPQVAGVREIRQLGAITGASVPLQVGGDTLGTFSLARLAGRPVLSADEVALAERIAARIAVAVAHARRYDREQRVAATLQEVLLPAGVPGLPGLRMAARYVPGGDDLQVGGDWYDVFALPGGRVGLVIGDVMGRGVRAAALMGQLRAAVRAYARLDLPPARTLELLDGLVHELEESAIVTAAYVVVDPARRAATYALAGHLPPLLVDGACRTWLDAVCAPPLGTGGAHAEASVDLPAGAVLALFTDGLVEDRRADLDDGLEALADAVGGGPGDPEELADHVLRVLGRAEGWDDDIALLVTRVD